MLVVGAAASQWTPAGSSESDSSQSKTVFTAASTISFPQHSGARTCISLCTTFPPVQTMKDQGVVSYHDRSFQIRVSCSSDFCDHPDFT